MFGKNIHRKRGLVAGRVLDCIANETQLSASVLNMDSLRVASTKVNGDNFFAPFGARVEKGQRHIRLSLAAEVPRILPTSSRVNLPQLSRERTQSVPRLEKCPAAVKIHFVSAAFFPA